VFGPPYDPANPYGYNPNAVPGGPSGGFGMPTGVTPFSPYVVGGLGGPTTGGLSPNGLMFPFGFSSAGSTTVGSSSMAGIFGLLGPASLNPFSIFSAPTLLNPFSLFGNPYMAPTVTAPTPTTTPSQTPPTPSTASGH
jgi:hypothetical protein